MAEKANILFVHSTKGSSTTGETARISTLVTGVAFSYTFKNRMRVAENAPYSRTDRRSSHLCLEGREEITAEATSMLDFVGIEVSMKEFALSVYD